MGEEEKSVCQQDCSGIEQARKELQEAKERFIESASAVNPLAYVREFPLKSCGGAFALGFGLTALSRQIAMIQIVPLILQSVEMMQRLFVSFQKK